MNTLGKLGRYEATLREALGTQATIKDQPERCALDPRALPMLGIVVGQQIRISIGSEFALFTVAATSTEDSALTVRMGTAALARIGGTFASTSRVTLEAHAARGGVDDKAAKTTSELAEVLRDDGLSHFLVALAPHGGQIEPGTDTQADHLATRLAARKASSWSCRGYKAGGGAFTRWHIMSTDVHPASFPGLSPLLRRKFKHAVAFHGFSQNEILLGGIAPLDFKWKAKAALDAALSGSGIPVRIADASDGYAGDSAKNIVNRLSPSGGLQLEQPLAARTTYGFAIADALASLYLSLPA